jgi:long-chain acyl-CoA synthetase
MEPLWLSQYPPGIPADIDIHEFASLTDVLLASCQRFDDLPAYSNMGTSMSYAELERSSRHFAAYLQKSLGLRRGDRVALMMPNLLQYPVALFGVLRAGLVVVNVNPQYTVPELEHQLLDSGAVAIVVLENFAHTLQAVLQRNLALSPVVITTEVGDLFPLVKEFLTNAVVKHVKHLVPPWKIAGAIEFNAALRAGHGQVLDAVPLCHDDTAFLQYTGGTTGVAKGAVLTHGNLVANVLQMAAWMARDLVDGAEVFVCPLPLYHVYALTSSLVFLKLGAHTILVTNPRDLPALIHDLQRHRFTIIIGVNTLYRALLDAPEFADVDTSALKLTSAGGMAVQRVVAERWKARTGLPIIEGYGMTETSPVVIASPLDIAEWTGSIGLPIPSTQAVILDDDEHELASRRGGRDLRARPAGHARLLEPPGRDRQGVHPRGLASHGRSGNHGRAGRLPDHGPQEGHDRRVRLQGVPEPDRGCGRPASRRGRGGGHRCAGRAHRRDRQDHRGQAGCNPHRTGAAGPLPPAPHRLQGAPDRRVPARSPAQVQPGQDPSKAIARGPTARG